MRLGIRLLFAFFLINGIAAFFVLRVFMAEIKPSVREVMEDMMVDTANLLAEVASDDLASGQLARDASQSRFAQRVRHYATRPIDAAIWGFSKQSLDYRIYVTDTTGRVLFDSENRAIGADYVAFSGHKMCGPTGIGVLYGRRALLDMLTPDETGGGMVVTVTYEGASWKPAPERHEAGTPNVADAIALGAACDYIDSIGRDVIHAHDHHLGQVAMEKLSAIPGIRIIGPRAGQPRGGGGPGNIIVLRRVGLLAVGAIVDDRCKAR
eukprot:gene4308-5492_t